MDILHELADAPSNSAYLIRHFERIKQLGKQGE